jgi:curli biogenesis system outer membrane secretion channel CsgG
MRSLADTLRPIGLCLVLAAAACGGKSSTRVDPGQDDNLGGPMIDSADVIASTDKAVADLVQVLLASTRSEITVAPATIKNESSQPINTAILTDRLIDKLVASTAPRVRYLAREQLDAVTKEREAKREGVFSTTEEKQLLGADYLLTGRITSLSKRSEGDRGDYFQLSFRLVDAESSAIVWANQYAFKKVGDSGVIYK